MLVLLTGCAVPSGNEEVDHGSPEPWAVTSPDDPAAEGRAARQLARLEVKGGAPMTGYDRAQFGAAWLDTDRNGCDTRNDMLTRDLEQRRWA
jgi:hypothetical protein